MSVTAIIPVRSLTDGKTRLAPVLETIERYTLNARFLSHILGVTSALSIRTMVVSRCEEARKIAQDFGVKSLFENTSDGLNSALDRASMVARARGAARILVLPADLPLVRGDDLNSLILRAGRAGSAIAPDRLRKGTNALCLPAGNSFRFRFGMGSFFLHQKEARKIGLDMVVIRSASLAFDVDSPSDFCQLQSIERDSPGRKLTKGLGQK